MEDNCDFDDSPYEVLYDTMIELTPDVNEDKSTIELFSSDTNALIFENGIVKNNFPK
jgi:hypothetical protein